MTLLVKNEDSIIEENLVFHKKMGVDGFIVTDNLSTDKTLDILKKYQKKGWILEIIEESEQNYNQYAWVNRMIWLAKEKYMADWVINSDADEFWYSKSGNLKNKCNEVDKLNKLKAFFGFKSTNVLVCYWKNIIPYKNTGIFWENTLSVEKSIEDPEKYNLSKWNMYAFVFPKVMHTTKGFKSILQGNHDVEIEFKRTTKNCDVIIYHYSIRNYTQFENKIIQGVKAYERNKDLEIHGQHWKYWYSIYKKGELHLEFERIIGSKYIEHFLSSGILKEDKSIYNFFSNIKERYT